MTIWRARARDPVEQNRRHQDLLWSTAHKRGKIRHLGATKHRKSLGRLTFVAMHLKLISCPRESFANRMPSRNFGSGSVVAASQRQTWTRDGREDSPVRRWSLRCSLWAGFPTSLCKPPSSCKSRVVTSIVWSPVHRALRVRTTEHFGQ